MFGRAVINLRLSAFPEQWDFPLWPEPCVSCLCHGDGCRSVGLHHSPIPTCMPWKCCSHPDFWHHRGAWPAVKPAQLSFWTVMDKHVPFMIFCRKYLTFYICIAGAWPKAAALQRRSASQHTQSHVPQEPGKLVTLFPMKFYSLSFQWHMNRKHCPRTFLRNASVLFTPFHVMCIYILVLWLTHGLQFICFFLFIVDSHSWQGCLGKKQPFLPKVLQCWVFFCSVVLLCDWTMFYFSGLIAYVLGSFHHILIF